MNRKYKVGIVGATGAVGQELIKLLFQRKFPMESLTLLASSRSAGKEIKYEGKTFVVEEATPDSFSKFDIAIFSAGGHALETARSGMREARLHRNRQQLGRSEWIRTCRLSCPKSIRTP